MMTNKEYYVNSFLYFAKSMSEKRFPFGSGFYDFLGFLIHEFYTILKPVFEEYKREVQNLVSLFSYYLNYTTIIYLFEHFPEQSAELVFILNNIKKLKFSKDEKELLEEVLEETILINNEDKQILMKKSTFSIRKTLFSPIYFNFTIYLYDLDIIKHYCDFVNLRKMRVIHF